MGYVDNDNEFMSNNYKTKVAECSLSQSYDAEDEEEEEEEEEDDHQTTRGLTAGSTSGLLLNALSGHGNT
jgi:hypothetical protein